MPRMTQPKVPAMTPEHIAAFERHAIGWLALSMEGALDRILLQDVLLLLRSLVSPAGRYVLVPREEIERVERGVMFKQLSAEYAEARAILRRWLSTPSTTEEEG